MSPADFTTVRRAVDEIVAGYGAFFEEMGTGHYRAVQGSAEVHLTVEQVGDDVLVKLRAPVSYDAELGERDLRFLLDANYDVTIGHFALTPEGHVELRHHLMGEYLQPDELRWLVRTIAIAADGLDDMLAQRTRGQRSVDAKPWLK